MWRGVPADDETLVLQRLEGELPRGGDSAAAVAAVSGGGGGGCIGVVVVLIGHLEVGAGGVLRQVEAGRRGALLGAEVRVAAVLLGRLRRGIIQLEEKEKKFLGVIFYATDRFI